METTCCMQTEPVFHSLFPSCKLMEEKCPWYVKWVEDLSKVCVQVLADAAKIQNKLRSGATKEAISNTAKVLKFHVDRLIDNRVRGTRLTMRRTDGRPTSGFNCRPALTWQNFVACVWLRVRLQLTLQVCWRLLGQERAPVQSMSVV